MYRWFNRRKESFGFGELRNWLFFFDVADLAELINITTFSLMNELDSTTAITRLLQRDSHSVGGVSAEHIVEANAINAEALRLLSGAEIPRALSTRLSSTGAKVAAAAADEITQKNGDARKMASMLGELHAMSAFLQRDYANALRLCDYVLNQDSQNAENYRARGIIHLAAGSIPKGLSDLKAAEKLNPELAKLKEPLNAALRLVDSEVRK